MIRMIRWEHIQFWLNHFVNGFLKLIFKHEALQLSVKKITKTKYFWFKLIWFNHKIGRIFLKESTKFDFSDQPLKYFNFVS